LKLIGGMHGAKWYEGFLTVSRWSGQLEPNGFGKVARIEPGFIEIYIERDLKLKLSRI
jgi:hypothetical protein